MTPRRLTGLLLLLAVAALAALLSGAPALASNHWVDYDTDDDGLIEVSNLAQLNAIRWDGFGEGNPTPRTMYLEAFPDGKVETSPRMGCPATCLGYELTADLNLDTNGNLVADSGDEYWNGGEGWTPILGQVFGTSFDAIFEGNGHVISNLFIDQSGNNVGLFGELRYSAHIRNVGLVHVDVTGGPSTGALVGNAENGTNKVSSSYATGKVTGTALSVGGLVGRNLGTIIASWADVAVTGSGNAGGFVGDNAGTITASYALGTVNGVQGDANGLKGVTSASGAVTNSYYLLAGSASTTPPAAQTAPGQRYSELQGTSGYVGIYANWNVDVDNADGDNNVNTGGDDPWDFGGSSEYPNLKALSGPEQRRARQPKAEYLTVNLSASPGRISEDAGRTTVTVTASVAGGPAPEAGIELDLGIGHELDRLTHLFACNRESIDTSSQNYRRVDGDVGDTFFTLNTDEDGNLATAGTDPVDGSLRYFATDDVDGSTILVVLKEQISSVPCIVDYAYTGLASSLTIPAGEYSASTTFTLTPVNDEDDTENVEQIVIRGDGVIRYSIPASDPDGHGATGYGHSIKPEARMYLTNPYVPPSAGYEDRLPQVTASLNGETALTSRTVSRPGQFNLHVIPDQDTVKDKKEFGESQAYKDYHASLQYIWEQTGGPELLAEDGTPTGQDAALGPPLNGSCEGGAGLFCLYHIGSPDTVLAFDVWDGVEIPSLARTCLSYNNGVCADRTQRHPTAPPHGATTPGDYTFELTITERGNRAKVLYPAADAPAQTVTVTVADEIGAASAPQAIARVTTRSEHPHEDYSVTEAGKGPDGVYGTIDDTGKSTHRGPDGIRNTGDDTYAPGDAGPDEIVGTDDDNVLVVGPDGAACTDDDMLACGPDGRPGTDDDQLNLGPDRRVGTADDNTYVVTRDDNLQTPGKQVTLSGSDSSAGTGGRIRYSWQQICWNPDANGLHKLIAYEMLLLGVGYCGVDVALSRASGSTTTFTTPTLPAMVKTVTATAEGYTIDCGADGKCGGDNAADDVRTNTLDGIEETETEENTVNLFYMLTVTDSAGNRDYDIVRVAVEEAPEVFTDTGPIARASATYAGGTGNPRPPALENTEVTLNGSSSRARQGSIASYQWTQTKGPAVELSNSDSSRATFTTPTGQDADKAYHFLLVVKDTDGSSDSAVVRIGVRARPTVAVQITTSRAQTRTWSEGDVIGLRGDIGGVDGETLTYTWSSEPASMNDVAWSGDLTGEVDGPGARVTNGFTLPCESNDTAYTFYLSVTDGVSTMPGVGFRTLRVNANPDGCSTGASGNSGPESSPPPERQAEVEDSGPLAGVSLDGIPLAFAADRTEYLVQVAHEVAQTAVRTADGAALQITANGATAEVGEAIPLEVGGNVINIAKTGEGESGSLHTVTVTRAGPAADAGSSSNRWSLRLDTASGARPADGQTAVDVGVEVTCNGSVFLTRARCPFEPDSVTFQVQADGSEPGEATHRSDFGGPRKPFVVRRGTHDYVVRLNLRPGSGDAEYVPFVLLVNGEQTAEARFQIDPVPGGATGQSRTNHAPVFEAGSSAVFILPENSAANVNVGLPLTATDQDEDTLTYTLSGADAGSFDLNAATGQLTTREGATYDYETQPAYALTVEAGDGNGGTANIQVTVELTNVNEAPAFGEGSSATRQLAENSAAGVNVGAAVSASDPDGDALTYTLSGSAAGSFSIDASTGQVQTRSGVIYDYETQTSYSLAVTANDGNGGTASIQVTVNLTDVEEAAPNRAPVFGEGDSATRTLAENTAGGENVGLPLTATDPDGNTLTYTLSGADAGSFGLNAATGQLTTKEGVSYDYEAKQTYAVTVTAEDPEGASASIAVTVNLTDVDETPPDTAPTVSDTSQLKNHDATVGQAFSIVLPAADEGSGNGGPYEYLLWHQGQGRNFMDQAINGLRFDPETRTLSGTPEEAGVWQLSYVVHDADANRSVEDRFRERENLRVTVSE